MTINTGLAQLSNGFIVAALLAYSLAVLAFAGDFAFGKSRAVRAVASDKVPQMATVGAGARVTAVGGEPGDGEAGPAPVGENPGSGGHRSWPGFFKSPSTALTQAQARPGPWVRAGLAATFAGLAVHMAGLITRGLAGHRLAWGDLHG